MRMGDTVPYVTVDHSDGKMRLHPRPALVTGYREDDSGPIMDLVVFHRGSVEHVSNARVYDHDAHGGRAGFAGVYDGGFDDIETDWQDAPAAPEADPRAPQWVQPASGGPMRRETPGETDARLAAKPGPASPARGFEATTGQTDINKPGPLPNQTPQGPNETSAPEPGPVAPAGQIQSTDSAPMSEPQTFNAPTGSLRGPVTASPNEDAGAPGTQPQADPQGGPQGGAKAR